MITTCAMIDLATARVANVIVADPETDNPWPGHALVVVPDGLSVSSLWGWDEDRGFFPADPDLAAELAARAEAEVKAAALNAYLLDD